ncbi:OmpA family protein [Virgibacillus soli]|uniref:OmpA family protein n=1 Tax=Paracerasibacillus soli TaxID=480284 RepID=A0ABU5CUK3_9BACI|nr:OmpA family protein [Virgibacillus soli]MDY0410046.1 OmpA family protein [Virgibacillus soli]
MKRGSKLRTKRPFYLFLIACFLLLLLAACAKQTDSKQVENQKLKETEMQADVESEVVEGKVNKPIEEEIAIEDMSDAEIRERYEASQVMTSVMVRSRVTTSKAAPSQIEKEVMQTLDDFNAVKADGGTMLTLPDHILFDFDSDQLRNEANKVLAQLVQVIDTAGGTVTILGHTDSKGTATYNQALSERRAQAVKDALVQKGIASSKMEAIGKGDTEPIANNAHPNGKDNPKGRQQNRRVEVVVQGL